MPNISGVTPNFIADLFDQAVVALSKDEQVLFYNRHAKYLFDKLATFRNLTEIITGEDLAVIRHNINIAFYQNNNFDFYWLYHQRMYTVAARLFKDILFLCLRDITEVRDQANILHQCDQRFNYIENLAQIGYWELHLPLKMVYWSDGMYNLFGITDKQKNIHRNLLRRYIHPEDMDLYRRQLRRLILDKISISGNIRIIATDNSIKQCRYAASPVYINGEDCACGILQNINENCHASSLLAAAVLGHEVKQHLQLIKLFNNDLSKNNCKEPFETSHKINTQVEKINLLLETAARSAQEEKHRPMQDIALKNVLKELCQEFKEVAQIKNIHFVCRLQHTNIIADKAVLSSILRNLLDNAFKFARHKVILGNNADKIWIIDDGCGISPTQQNKIFNRFYQASDKSGWGLGLYTVKENAKRINAEISVKSRPNHYTVFRLKFLQNNSCQIAK